VKKGVRRGHLTLSTSCRGRTKKRGRRRGAIGEMPDSDEKAAVCAIYSFYTRHGKKKKRKERSLIADYRRGGKKTCRQRPSYFCIFRRPGTPSREEAKRREGGGKGGRIVSYWPYICLTYKHAGEKRGEKKKEGKS